MSVIVLPEEYSNSMEYLSNSEMSHISNSVTVNIFEFIIENKYYNK